MSNPKENFPNFPIDFQGKNLRDRGYNRGEIKGQFDRVRELDRSTLFDRNQGHRDDTRIIRDDTRIPLVLTFHPAFHKVYEILQKCLNALLVDNEHRHIFEDKISFRLERLKTSNMF